MRFILFSFFIFCVNLHSSAQKITAEQSSQIEKIENEIKIHANNIVDKEEAIDRYREDSFFTRGLVRALRVPNSFYYPFDSLTTISKVYAPDTSFRIFTWQLMKDFISYRYKGAIQMRTSDGSLKLIPLFDNSEFTTNVFDSARSKMNWVGAIYYKVILKTYNNKKYYTLLGFTENEHESSRKWIEVMTFDNAGEPVFGGRYFQYPADSTFPVQPAYRFCIEYKREAVASMNYDPDLDIIVFPHLISESHEPEHKYTLIPDGDYFGFHWVNGKWIFVKDLFQYKVDMNGVDMMQGKPPLEAPLLDNNGNLDEKKLEEQSEKNKKSREKPPVM